MEVALLQMRPESLPGMIKTWVVRVRPAEPPRSGFPKAFGDQQLAGTDSHHPVLIAPEFARAQKTLFWRDPGVK